MKNKGGVRNWSSVCVQLFKELGSKGLGDKGNNVRFGAA